MTRTPAELVASYCLLPRGGNDLGDCDLNHPKPEILRQIDEHANMAIVSELLLEILRSADEYDLARIEATKIVGIYVNGASPLERPLKRQVWNIFANPREDTLVRQHASQNISIGFGGPFEQDVIENLLFDEADDIDVRHGALAYLRKTTDAGFAHRMIGRLSPHPYWGKFQHLFDHFQQ